MTVSGRKDKSRRAGNVVSLKPKRSSIDPPRMFVYVDAVARHGSIRKAAEALHVVSSALNRRILDLVAQLGSPIFERLPRGVRPTAEGEVYLDYVRGSLRELANVNSQIEGLRGLLKGRVRIAVAESVTHRMLPQTIARFQARHAGVGFHVWVDGPMALAASLASDEADLILTHDLLDHPEVAVVAVRAQPFVAVVAPSHPLASRSHLHLRDCLAYPVALPDESLYVRQLIDRVLLQSSFKFEPAMVSNSVELTKLFARANNGVAFQFSVGKEPDNSGMVEIPIRDPGFSEARLYLATRPGRVLPSAATTFVKYLADSFADL